MCPFGMTEVPARREYFGRLEEAVSMPTQTLLLHIGHGRNNKKGATRIDLRKEAVVHICRKPPEEE